MKNSLVLIALSSMLAACVADTGNSSSSAATAVSSQATMSSEAASSSEATSSSAAPLDFTAFNNADGINGGRLYSKFWATETGFSLANSNLNDQSELTAISDKGDFFRCKQCHGWDRLGQDGGYSNRKASTTRPTVADLDLASLSDSAEPHSLFDAIKNGASRRAPSADLANYNPSGNSALGDQMPDYSMILTDAQIWDIVKYLKEEALDTTELYTLTVSGGNYPDATPAFSDIGGNGNANNGDQIYASKCSACHGNDGTLIMVDGGEYTVGAHMRAKPYEDQHKVKFGNLGSTMTAVLANSDISEIRDLMKAMTNTTKYPDSAPVIETINGKALFENYCSSCHSANGVGTAVHRDVTGKTASNISREIMFERDMQGLSFLTTEQIDAIAGFIAR